MNTTRTTLRVLASALLTFVSFTLSAQNSYTPPPITTTNPAFTWDASVFSVRMPAFALGHQWGTSSLDKVNTALKMNVTADHYGIMYMNGGAINIDAQGRLAGSLNDLYHLGQGYRDTNYVIWGSPMDYTPEHIDFVGKWMGMRWEPAENAGLSRSWTPRDADAWPFSFAAKHYGTIPTSSSDANYRRYMLAQNTTLTYPVKVLDSVEPRDQLFMRDVNVKWATPLDSAITSGPSQTQEDSSNCRRLRLVVNMRRTNPSDNVIDDSVVASIVVPYQMRWKNQDPTDDRYEPRRLRMPFDSVVSQFESNNETISSSDQT